MKIIVLDTETTGLEKPIGVVEVAWLELDEDLGIVPDSEFSQIVNPGIPITDGAAGIHGIRDEDFTEDTPVLADLDWPTGEILLVGHNVSFDRPLVEEYMNVVADLCTMKMARRLLPDSDNHQLQTLGSYCGLTRELPHRALGDILTTAYLLDYMSEGADMNVGELYQFMERPQIFTIMPYGKWRGKPMEKVPKGYLKWLSKKNVDADMEATLNHYL